jgi:hypothetical protein
MNTLSSVFVVIFLLLGAATSSKLVYLEKPTDEAGIEFVGKMANV